MSDPTGQALALWGMEGADCTFVTGRENRVYRVRTATGDYALRLRRPGLRSAAELVSELHWLQAMDKAGLHVPRPVPSRSGAFLEDIGGLKIDMLGWLPGRPLRRAGAPLDARNAPEIFARVGREMARMHRACDAWTRPDGFTRAAWDADGLLGARPIWGRFWDNPTLDTPTRALMERFRAAARGVLTAEAASLDTGLIHADLIGDNIMVDGEVIHMLDFDDGGFGFRLFDVATTLFKTTEAPEYPALKAALLAGYREVRPLDTRLLDLFMGLRAATYVGWIVPRMDEEGAARRNARFIDEARHACGAWLDQHHTA